MKRKKTIGHLKNKKLYFPLFLILLIASFSNAIAQTKVGVKAGVNFSNVILKDENGDKGETQSMPGVVFGLTVDVPIGGDFYIQPAVLYADKGYKQKTGGYSGLATNFKVNVSYVQVPVNLVYKPKLGTGRLLLGAGPYLQYGTSGTWKSDNTILIGDIMTDSKGKTIFKNDFMDGEFGSYLYGKRLDYGANFLVGYEFLGKFTVEANAMVGLANLQPEVDGVERDGSLKNTAFGFTVGYKF